MADFHPRRNLLSIGLMMLWNTLEYFTPHPIIPHKRVTLILPYSTQNEATNMIPMGETIAHPIPGGHQGIDFQWDHSIPRIAVANGSVSDITHNQDIEQPVL